MTQHILVSGDNIVITQINDEDQLVEALNAQRIEDDLNTTLPVAKYDQYGISTQLYKVGNLSYHKLQFVEELRAKMLAGDAFDAAAARELPEYILMCAPGHVYDEETRYQIWRNQQANFGPMIGAGLFKAHEYGDLFENTVTGERVKRHMGINPFDDWEKITRNAGHKSLPTNIMVASGGNYSQVSGGMDPWYPGPAGGDDPIRFMKFLQDAKTRTERNAKRRASILRTLNGKDNPISGPR